MAPRSTTDAPAPHNLPSFAVAFPAYSSVPESSRAMHIDAPPSLKGRKRSHTDKQSAPPSPKVTVKDEVDELDDDDALPLGKRRRTTVSGQRPQLSSAPPRPPLPLPPPSSSSSDRRGSLPGAPGHSPLPPPARLPAPPVAGAKALPEQSISFTARKLGAGAGPKLGHILVSPRDAAPAPSIMSAPAATERFARPPPPLRPPVPATRFPPPGPPPPPAHYQNLHGPATPGMALPHLPPAPRTGLRVPGTPRGEGFLSVPQPGPGPAPPSPRVPPTPGVLRSFPSSGALPSARLAHHAAPGAAAGAGARDAFLAPFAAFYDTLRDAAELRAFLAASVAKAERAAGVLDERVAPLREEVAALRRRTALLEEEVRVLRAANASGAAAAGEGFAFPPKPAHTPMEEDAPAPGEGEAPRANGSRPASEPHGSP